MKLQRLNATELKLIAIIAMTIDHVAWLCYPGLVQEPLPILLHLIGRLTAPIMWFFIAEGCHYTKNIQQYFLRLFLFAVISHVAFCFGLGIPFNPAVGGIFNRTSVLFPLALSVLLIAIFQNERLKDSFKIGLLILFCGLTFCADWSTVALMAPFFLYQNRQDRTKQMKQLLLWIGIYMSVYIIFIDLTYGLVQLGTLLTIPLLKRYDGSKGSLKLSKWFFYWYYPGHLLVIGLLRIWLYGNIPLVF